jgi:beta-lactamase class C
VDGYRSLILFDPVEKSGIAMLWNSHSSKPVGLQLEMLDMLYGLPRQDWLKLDTPAQIAQGAGRQGRAR